MRMIYTLPFVLFASPAFAICNADEATFMSCQIIDSDKVLSVCFTDKIATYRFGTTGEVPELTIVTSIAKLNYTPWNGIGRAIYEVVSFENGDYIYEASAGFEKQSQEQAEPAAFGGVHVSQHDAKVVDLDCLPETVRFDWDEALFEAKERAGYIWDHDSFAWVAKPN